MVEKLIIIYSLFLFTCFFLIIDLSLSVVMSIPWKLVKHILPCVSSMMSLNFLNDSSFSFKSPSDTSNTRPLRPSDAISIFKLIEIKQQKKNNFYFFYCLLVPVVLVTQVLPIWRVLNWAGALTSYQSFFENGFILYNEKNMYE